MPQGLLENWEVIVSVLTEDPVAIECRVVAVLIEAAARESDVIEAHPGASLLLRKLAGNTRTATAPSTHPA